MAATPGPGRALGTGSLLLTVPFAWLISTDLTLPWWVLVPVAAVGACLVVAGAIQLVLAARRGQGPAVGTIVTAVLPLFAFLVVIKLGAARRLDPGWALVVTLAPSAIALLLTWRAAHREGRGLRPPARAWRLGGPITALVMAPVVAAAATAAYLALVLAIAGIFVQLAMPAALGSIEQRARVLEVARPHRLPPDPAATAPAVAAAFYRLALPPGGTLAPTPVKRPPGASHPRWLPTPHPFGKQSPDQAVEALVARAAAGALPPDVMDYLGRVAAHPGFADYALVARAATLDIPATHVVLPIPPETHTFDLVLLPYWGLQQGARAHVARAAWELAQGRRDQAEATLRQGITIASLVGDNASSLLDMLVAARAAALQLHPLAAVYQSTGRAAAAEELRVALAATGFATGTAQAWAAPPAFEIRPDPSLRWARRWVVGGLQSRAVPRGLKWELLHQAAILPCASAAELTFGPRPDLEHALVAARFQLARQPGERAWFEVLEQSLARLPGFVRRSGAGPIARATATIGPAWLRLAGGPRTAGCGALPAMVGNLHPETEIR